MTVNVAFVVPFAMSTTLRFVKSVAGLPGVRLGLITMEPIERLRPDVREHVAAHWQVGDAFDVQQLLAGVRGVETQLGGRVTKSPSFFRGSEHRR
jgi:hypothetical protein